MLQIIDRWHRTRIGYVLTSIIELIIAYGFACLAINQGHVWWYLLVLIFFVGALQNLLGFFKLLFKTKLRKPA